MASFIVPSLNQLEKSADGKIDYQPRLPFINNNRHTDLGTRWFIRYLLLPLYLPLSPVIFIFRVLFAALLLLVLASTCFLLNLGTDPTKPLGRVRSAILSLVATPVIRLILLSMGYIVIVKNKQKMDRGAYVFVANHTDFMDIPCMYCAVGTAYVSKEAIMRFWPLKAISGATRTILIHRTVANECTSEEESLLSPDNAHPRSSGFSQLEARIKTMKADKDGLWQPILIFPEGTTTAGTGILRLHTSVFRLGVTVQPVSIRYYSCTHTEYVGKSLLRIVLRKLLDPFCLVVITYLNPVLPDEHVQPQELADKAGKSIAASLNVPYLPYTSEDGFYFRNLRPTAERCTPEFLRDYGWVGTEDSFNLRADNAFTEEYRLPKGPIISNPN